MSINYAILGMLSCKPLTGYELKKIMQESSFMHWSGNNNQIYKALLELNDQDFVTGEVHHQESSPSKKVYTITEAGVSELKKWSQSRPEAVEMKRSFLVQLAWADLLKDEELEALLNQYEQEIKGQLLMEEKKAQTGFFKEGRTPRETILWGLINESILMSYQAELDWVNKAKKTLFAHDKDETNDRKKWIEEREEMNYEMIEKNNQRYLWLDMAGKKIETEQDGMELLTLCMENSTNLLLIHGDRLSDDFLRLGTGLAGAVLQKFVQYHIKSAAIIDESRTKGKFQEFLTESNKGHFFRSFNEWEMAEQWLLANPIE